MLFAGVSTPAGSSYCDDALVKAVVDASEIRNNNSGSWDSPASEYSKKLISINNALNARWGTRKSRAFAKCLNALWENVSKQIPANSWPEINHPIVKTEIAGLLGQAGRLGMSSPRQSKLREYVRNNVKSSNPIVRSIAIRALGSVGNEADIDVLKELVKSERNGIAEKAAHSLFMLDIPGASDALKDLYNDVNRESLRNFIKRLI